ETLKPLNDLSREIRTAKRRMPQLSRPNKKQDGALRLQPGSSVVAKPCPKLGKSLLLHSKPASVISFISNRKRRTMWHCRLPVVRSSLPFSPQDLTTALKDGAASRSC